MITTIDASYFKDDEKGNGSGKLKPVESIQEEMMKLIKAYSYEYSDNNLMDKVKDCYMTQENYENYLKIRERKRWEND